MALQPLPFFSQLSNPPDTVQRVAKPGIDQVTVGHHHPVDGTLASLQLSAQPEDFTHDEGRPGQGLGNLEVAPFDAFGQGDLPFAGQQRNRPHLLIVEADRVGLAGAVQSAGCQVQPGGVVPLPSSGSFACSRGAGVFFVGLCSQGTLAIRFFPQKTAAAFREGFPEIFIEGAGPGSHLARIRTRSQGLLQQLVLIGARNHGSF